MLYYATASGPKVRSAMRDGLLGQMMNPNVGNRREPGVRIAVDAGTVKIVDKRPVNDPAWNAEKWERYLARMDGADFAVVPDWVCDAEKTDARWVEYLPVVLRLGHRPAYVLQNGCTGIPPEAEVVFVGGDDEFKDGPDAAALIAEAKARGLWVHMGRVNTLTRIRRAALRGCDSVDGTTLAWGPDRNLPQLLRWIHPYQPSFWGVA